jgi:hypothetical protein
MPQGLSFLCCLHCLIISTHALKLVQDTVQPYNISTAKLYSGGKGYGEMCAYKGKIYMSPHNAADLMIVDTATDEVSLADTSSLRQGAVGESCKGMPYWFSMVPYKDKIYASPGCTDQILIYDTVTKQASGVNTRKADGLPMLGGEPSPIPWLGMTECNGKLYAAPAESDNLLVYDLETGEVTGVDTSSVCTNTRTVGLKFMGMACWEGKVYAAPVEANADKSGKTGGTCDELLIYDTVKGEVSSISTKELTREDGMGGWKWHGMTVLNGVIYAVPANAENILIYDTKTGKLSGASTRHLGGARTHMWAGMTTDGHKIYGGPQRNHQILVYDPETQEVSGLDVHGVEGNIHEDNAAWNGIAYWDGKLYSSAYNTDAVLVYDLKGVSK